MDSTGEAMRRLLVSYASENKWMSIASVASTLVTPIQDILLPHLTGRVVNAIRNTETSLAASKGGGGGKSEVMWSFVAVGVGITAVQIAYFGVDLVDAHVVPSVMTFVRRRMLRCLLDANDTSQAGELETGDLLAKFVKVPITVANWYESLKGLVPNGLAFVFAIAYFWWIDAALGVALLVGVFATFVAFVSNLRSCGDVSEARDVALNQLHERIDEVLHNLPAVFASGQKANEIAALEPLERSAERLYFNTVWCATGVKLWMVPVALVMVFAMLWRSLQMLRSRTMSVGQFVSIFGIILYLMTSMLRIVQNSRSMVYYWGIIKTSLDMLGDACGPAVRTSGGGGSGRRRGSGAPPLIELEGVSFTHANAGVRVLDSVSLSIERGDRVAIIGKMGSGKTTLLRLIMRLIEPTEGTLRLRGVPYADLSVETVRRAFGYVPQGAALFDRTILQNAYYGVDRPPDEAEFWDAAADLGVDGVLRALPAGTSTAAGKGGSRLSGGQRQAVWLVRMRLLDPEVLVLDEPTSAMDPESRSAVARAIARFRTVLFVTHDDAFVASVATRRITIFSLRGGGRSGPHPGVKD